MWERAFKPADEHESWATRKSGPIEDKAVRRKLLLCGDLCELTYNNFLASQQDVDAFMAQDPHAPNNLAPGMPKWTPRALMERPPGRTVDEVRFLQQGNYIWTFQSRQSASHSLSIS